MLLLSLNDRYIVGCFRSDVDTCTPDSHATVGRGFCDDDGKLCDNSKSVEIETLALHFVRTKENSVVSVSSSTTPHQSE